MYQTHAQMAPYVRIKSMHTPAHVSLHSLGRTAKHVSASSCAQRGYIGMFEYNKMLAYQDLSVNALRYQNEIIRAGYLRSKYIHIKMALPC